MQAVLAASTVRKADRAALMEPLRLTYSAGFNLPHRHDSGLREARERMRLQILVL